MGEQKISSCIRELITLSLPLSLTSLQGGSRGCIHNLVFHPDEIVQKTGQHMHLPKAFYAGHVAIEKFYFYNYYMI